MTCETKTLKDPLLDVTSSYAFPITIDNPNTPTEEESCKEDCLNMCMYYPPNASGEKKLRTYKITGTVLHLICSGLMIGAFIMREKDVDATYQKMIWIIFGIFFAFDLLSWRLSCKEEENLLK